MIYTAFAPEKIRCQAEVRALGILLPALTRRSGLSAKRLALSGFFLVPALAVALAVAQGEAPGGDHAPMPGMEMPGMAAVSRGRRAEVDALVAQPSPATLATAALLSYPPENDPAQPLQLIERAETMAPGRPDLVWIERAICRRLNCGAAQSIENHLQELDPDNGFAWIPDLERAEQGASDDAVTAAIARIGAATKMTFYWNSLEVTVFDGLTAATPRESLANRALEATGVLAAMAIPPLQPLTKPCRADQFGIPGRREACQLMATRMEHADSLLAQGLALSMQVRWWPENSAQRDSLRIRRRQLDYEMQMSGRTRWRMNRDMAIRIQSARTSLREEDVAIAVMKAYRIPLAAPPDWKDKRETG